MFSLCPAISPAFLQQFFLAYSFCQQVRYNVLTAGTIPENPPDPAVTFPILYMTRGVIKLHTGTMWALVKDQPAKGLSMKRVEIPTVGENDVMIKIHKTAICGTDSTYLGLERVGAKYLPCRHHRRA